MNEEKQNVPKGVEYLERKMASREVCDALMATEEMWRPWLDMYRPKKAGAWALGSTLLYRCRFASGSGAGRATEALDCFLKSNAGSLNGTSVAYIGYTGDEKSSSCFALFVVWTGQLVSPSLFGGPLAGSALGVDCTDWLWASGDYIHGMVGSTKLDGVVNALSTACAITCTVGTDLIDTEVRKAEGFMLLAHMFPGCPVVGEGTKLRIAVKVSQV